MTYFKDLMKALAIIAALCAMAAITGCASSPVSGNWKYSDGNTKIGLDLLDGEACELSLSRFVSQDLKRQCRYELNKMKVKNAEAAQKSYLIYLHDDAGRCDAFADFEFIHDSNSGLLTFLVGDTPFYMQKQVN